LALIIHDECHSCINESSFKFLSYAQTRWFSSIIGFSATPLRLTTNNNNNQLSKLLQLFGKTINSYNKLNIVVNYSMNQAIIDDVILKPNFYWYKATTKEHIMSALNEVIPKMKYKKIIAWCGTIEKANIWNEFFSQNKTRQNKNKYVWDDLVGISNYVDHSKNTNQEYLNFFNIKEKGILFCASKHREGSDIPFLDGCVFLDGIQNRSPHTFIQSIGRVLRKDSQQMSKTKQELNQNNKKSVIIDFIIKKQITEDMVIEKIIKYYEYITNLSFSSDNNVNDDIDEKNDGKKKFRKYTEYLKI